MKRFFCAILICSVFFMGWAVPHAESLTQANSEIYKEWDVPAQKEWKAFKAGVEKKWKKFVHSTKEEWVSYDAGKDVRSVVNFKDGYILFETVIPKDDPDAAEKARDKIGKQAGDIFKEEAVPGKKILENLVVNTKGFCISVSNQKEFITKEIAPEVRQVAEKSFFSKDGVARQKYTVRIPMVKGHTKILAKKYMPLVRKYVKEFHLKPELILAIIHTESYFNPRAVSHCGALGLMQLVPKSGGLQAYSHVYGEETIPSKDYLFNPEKNIELGCAYFDWLKIHFKSVKEEVKRRYICICGYNCGPGNVRKVLKRHQIFSMTDKEVYQVLRRETPEETRGYIKNVVSRMPNYVPFISDTDSKPDIPGKLWSRLVRLAENASYKVKVQTNQERFKADDHLRITCHVQKQGYLTVLSISPDDTRADILYPNKLHPDNHVAEKGKISIPAQGDDFVLRCKPPAGDSLIVVFHTKKRINAYQDGEGKPDALFKKMSESSLKHLESEKNQGFLGAGKVLTSIE